MTPKEKLNDLRNFLISKEEIYHNESLLDTASPCGSHYDRGRADSMIEARAKLEELFDIFDI